MTLTTNMKYATLLLFGFKRRFTFHFHKFKELNKKKKERSELKGATECMHSEIEIEISGGMRYNYTVNRCVRVQTKYKRLVDFDVVQLALSEINIQFCAHPRFKNVTKPKLTCSKNQLYNKDYITKQLFSIGHLDTEQLFLFNPTAQQQQQQQQQQHQALICLTQMHTISRFHPFSAGKNLDNFLFHFTTSPLERTD
ncbi:hypothetical protein T05_3880 [Trichinella murrelli]|uniref:Uncharacterized protein n=1 Tax=Trichinella murrelli TaxID=144512 RepID=A0A0V0UBY5_9BILA|nr:hypothetical protein T05_3880 [Trichinella murrelli]